MPRRERCRVTTSSSDGSDVRHVILAPSSTRDHRSRIAGDCSRIADDPGAPWPSDPALSKQVATLEDAGYVMVRKGYVGKRPRTWLSLSQAGRQALQDHLAALRGIAGA